jgi:CRISPR-associated endoribonuclease Cas6
MPASLELPLDRRLAKRLPPNAVPALHANFFRWLEASDQALARTLDASQGIKPFTTSPLFVTREWASFRITLLQESLLERLENGIRARPEVDVLGQILPILVGDLSIMVADYELMLTNATTETRQAVLEFRTPMSCRSDGMDYPLPDPELVFDSYRKRWNTFAPQHLFISESWLDWLRASVAVSRFDLKTEPIRFPDGLQIGCVGRVRYLVLEPGLGDREAVAVFNCLADYACFCGTGRKTTQGMGQTTRLAHD